MEFEETRKRNLLSCFTLYDEYSWLINCYVVDFFTENHWKKLCNNWQLTLENLSPDQIAQLLSNDDSNKHLWPLSILAIKNILRQNSISREIVPVNVDNTCFSEDSDLGKFFWRKVKAKKRHEISIMSKICYKSAVEANCFYIVDVGSGLGHLSRMLNYGYNLKVCTIEARKLLTEQARNQDQKFETMLQKKSKDTSKTRKTVHVNMKIEATLTATEFLKIITGAFEVDNKDFKFGIVGLHPCGDLGTHLLKLYNNCSNAVFINIVGCCYMKLSTLPSTNQGFPLSQFCVNNNYELSYQSREIACHAIENYIDKLREGECWRLKIHTYRALLEKIVIELRPDLKHCAVNSCKFSEDLTFTHYCQRALSRLRICLPDDRLSEEATNPFVTQWKKVVVFYSLRLMFAPLIETIILLDRLLYVEESGSRCQILPVFESKISPRNHVLMATKI